MRRRDIREGYLEKLDTSVERSCQILFGNVDYKNTFDRKIYERVSRKRKWLSSIDFPSWVKERSDRYYNDIDDITGDVLLFYSIALAVIRFNSNKEKTIDAIMSSIVAKHIRKLDSAYIKSKKHLIVNIPFNGYQNDACLNINKLPMEVLLEHARGYEDRRWYLLEYTKVIMGYTNVDYSEIAHIPIGTIKEINRCYENIRKPKKSSGGSKRNPPREDSKVWARPSSRGPAEGQVIPPVGPRHQLYNPGVIVRLRRKYGY